MIIFSILVKLVTVVRAAKGDIELLEGAIIYSGIDNLLYSSVNKVLGFSNESILCIVTIKLVTNRRFTLI